MMIKKKYLICYLFAPWLFWYCELYASFENIIDNTYINSIGGNGVVLAKGVWGFFSNPANSIYSDKFEFDFSRRILGLELENTDLNESSVKAVFQIDKNNKLGHAGLGYSVMSLSSLYKENILLINYSRFLLEKIVIGVNIGYYKWEAELIESIYYSKELEKWSKRCFVIDLGAGYELDNSYFGFSLKNINSPEIYKSSGENKLPTCFKIGIGRKNQIFDYETGVFSDNNQELKCNFGAEYNIIKNFFSLLSGIVFNIGSLNSPFEELFLDSINTGGVVRINLHSIKIYALCGWRYILNKNFENIIESNLSMSIKI